MTTRLGNLAIVTFAIVGARWLGALRLADSNSADTAGKILATGNMTVPRFGHTATLLPNGKVLIAGGMTGNGHFLASTELYDPSSGQFVSAGKMESTRGYGSIATVLPSGKVLIAGGHGDSFCNRSAELYDADKNTFALMGSMTVPRCSAIAVLLQNGLVLIAGGDEDPGDREPTASAELYNPSTGRFTVTGDMHTRRDYFTAVLLHDGRVLVAGGSSAGQHPNTTVEASAEVYDPHTGRFSRAGDMTTPRDKLGAAILPDGRVLIVGGQADSPFGASLSSTEIYDPASARFAPGPAMAFNRFKLPDGVVPLKDGTILVAGGAERPELYEPASKSFEPTAGSKIDRFYFSTATLLGNGEVLLAGGYGTHSGGSAVSHAWLYQSTSGR